MWVQMAGEFMKTVRLYLPEVIGVVADSRTVLAEVNMCICSCDAMEFKSMGARSLESQIPC